MKKNNLDTQETSQETWNRVSETVDNAHVEGYGVIEKTGFISVLIYTWYIWGVDYDFLRWGFLGYLVTFSLITFIPKGIVGWVFYKDRIYTKLEQVLFVIFSALLVYFIAPSVVGWFN